MIPYSRGRPHVLHCSFFFSLSGGLQTAIPFNFLLSTTSSLPLHILVRDVVFSSACFLPPSRKCSFLDDLPNCLVHVIRFLFSSETSHVAEISGKVMLLPSYSRAEASYEPDLFVFPGLAGPLVSLARTSPLFSFASGVSFDDPSPPPEVNGEYTPPLAQKV